MDKLVFAGETLAGLLFFVFWRCDSPGRPPSLSSTHPDSLQPPPSARLPPLSRFPPANEKQNSGAGKIQKFDLENPKLEKELREGSRLLWAGGLKGKKKAKGRKNKVAALEQQTAAGGGRAGGLDGGSGDAYRLVVTDDGNAVLERGGAEVVWKALDR